MDLDSGQNVTMTNEPAVDSKAKLPLLWIIFFIIFTTLGIVAFVFGFYNYVNKEPLKIVSPLSPFEQETPLNDYAFNALSQRQYDSSPIILDEVLDDTDPDFISYLFSYDSDGKKVTGQINLPTGYEAGKSAAIIMIRGYVDPDIYQTGVGTKNAAAVFARAGYVTIAPDFLGYGDSDMPGELAFEDRLMRPVTVLNLIESVKDLDYVDSGNIGIWAHSNGGQIAISLLEITSHPYPTTLWAPVTKPFPYSVLYYTDEYEDLGKAMRKVLANFEELYDVNDFSIHAYMDRINAPIQLHQGGNDDAIPLEWSKQFVENLQEIKDSTTSGKSLDIEYYTYPAADHNLRPNWDTVIQRDTQFFKKYLD